MRIVANGPLGLFVNRVMFVAAFATLQVLAFSEAVGAESEQDSTLALAGLSKASGPKECVTSEVRGNASATRSEPPTDNEKTLRRKIELLESGRTFLLKSGDYTADLDKREEVRGQLQDEQSMFLKCRHEPLSIYMVWNAGDVGREIIYVEGANDGRMIAHDGGWKSKIPAFSLQPDCPLAMRDSRYPVTRAGLLGLTEEMIRIHESDLATPTIEDCQCELDAMFDGRKCLLFTTRYKSPELSPEYRKCVTLIDHEWNVPLCTEQFCWPSRLAAVEVKSADEKTVDADTLIERYAYRNVKFHQKFQKDDFDRTNAEYHFR